MDKESRKELFSMPSLATFLSAAIAVWAYHEEELLIAVSTLSVLSILLVGYLLVMHRKYRKIKRFKEIDEEIHRLTHRMRDYLTELQASLDNNEAKQVIGNATKSALTTASNIFTILTGEKCVASLMLPDRNTGKLHTVQYSFDVDPQREGNRSNGLDKDQGVAGLAFNSGDVVVWDNHDSQFVRIRENYEECYLSGISIPFKAGYSYAGILNVDCMACGVFNKREHKQVGAALADALGIITEVLSMWENKK